MTPTTRVKGISSLLRMVCSVPAEMFNSLLTSFDLILFVLITFGYLLYFRNDFIFKCNKVPVRNQPVFTIHAQPPVYKWKL